MITQIDHCEHVAHVDKHIKVNYPRYLFPELSGQAWHGIFDAFPFFLGKFGCSGKRI